MDPSRVRVRTTCPRDCYDACGIVAELAGGVIKRIVGDPDHQRARGTLCGKCALAYNGSWIDAALRLTSPLRRSGKKGRVEYQPVSWEVALAEIAARLRPLLAEGGGTSVLHTHYTGTCSLIAGTFPNRFFNYIGATEVDPDSVCNKAGHEALQRMFGVSTFGFDPRTAADSRCVIVWGANPSASAPHVHAHWLKELRPHAKLIVVDPIRHDSAALADLHLQPRPGTDALLAFSLLHVLNAQGRIDEQFLARSALGWDAVLPDIAAATPERAFAVTGVAAADIVQAAEWYGDGPSMLWLGQGLQRQATGGNVIRSVALLPTATGNLGRSGTGLLYINGSSERGVDGDALGGTALRRGAAATISHMDLASALEDRSRTRALFTWNNNVAASSPEQARLRRALAADDLLHVAVDLFHTDTTAYADYVLPAASFLEFDDLVLSYFDYTVSAQARVVPALGDSLPNQEIFRRLARAMDLAEPALYEPDVALLESLLRQLGINLNFKSLAEVGTVVWRDQPVIPFADDRYPTASGKIEIASIRWQAAGMPFAPAAHADPPPAAAQLRLLSPADPWLMNSSCANDPYVDRKLGAQRVWLNALEAARRQLAEHQPVRVHNATGSLDVLVGISERVPPGVALLPKGRWPSRDGAGANVNVLNPGAKSDIGESCAVHSVEIAISAR